MAAPFDTKGQCAVVTGSASGIGRSVALQLADKGVNLALADIDEKGLKATLKEVEARGVKAFAAKVDMANFEEVDSFAAKVFDWAETPLRLVFANAGIHGIDPAIDPDLEKWDHVIAVNLMGPVHMSKAFVPRLMRQDQPAQFVITGSQASFVAAPGLAPYVSAKHALWGFADSLRMELQMEQSKVGVSLVAPSRVATGITLPRVEETRRTEGEEAAAAYRAAMTDPEPIAEVMIREAIKREFWIIPSHESTLELFRSRADAVINAMPAGVISAS